MYGQYEEATLKVRGQADREAIAVERTNWMFYGLTAYLVSQSFTIPVMTVGLSWAVWPILSDISLGFLLLVFWHNYRSTLPLSRVCRHILLTLLLIIGGSVIWYLVPLLLSTAENQTMVRFGAFQIYRLVQFTLVFFIACKTPLTISRVVILSKFVTLALLFACITVALTAFSVVSPSSFATHLPRGFDVAGPWEFYQLAQGQGWGTLGYNHSYIAAQVLMFVSLRIHLRPKDDLINSLILLVAIAATYVTSSRTGLVTVLIFAAVFIVQRFRHVTVGFLILLSGGLILSNTGFLEDNAFDFSSTNIERQLALSQPFAQESLNGRIEIWADRVAFLSQEPMLLFTGAGFGSAMESNTELRSDNAHMLYLQIVLEAGLLGLVVFLLFCTRILRALYKYEQASTKPIFWVTVAFLVSSLTQETFYPVPAFLHFIGFYLASLAIALRFAPQEPSTQSSFEVTQIKFAGQGHLSA